MADLHFFGDGGLLPGSQYAAERDLTLERFISELMIPFFYRLSYTDRYGLTAAKVDLWGEYPHGVAGEIQYQDETFSGLPATNPAETTLAPAGVG